MALKSVLETLDGVEEHIQALYKEGEKDGKVVYFLDVEGTDDLPSVVGLKTARDNLLKEKREAAKKLREAEAQIQALPEDFDVDKWEELKALAEAHEQDPNNQDIHRQIEAATNAVKQQWETKLEAQKKKSDEEKAELKAERDREREFSRKNLIQSVITKSLSEANIKPALMEAAEGLIERKIDVVEEVDDETGEQIRRVLMKPEYGGEEPSKYIQSWIQTDAGREFVIPASGSGSQGNNRHRTTETNPWAKETFNLTDQGRILKEDRAKAERLAKAAGRSLAL